LPALWVREKGNAWKKEQADQVSAMRCHYQEQGRHKPLQQVRLDRVEFLLERKLRTGAYNGDTPNVRKDDESKCGEFVTMTG